MISWAGWEERRLSHPPIPPVQPVLPSFMSLSAVLFLFLVHLGVGIAATLLFVSREAGVKFFRFNAGLAAVLIAIALALRDGLGSGMAPGAGLVALVCGEAALVAYWGTVGRTLARIRPALEQPRPLFLSCRPSSLG